MPGNPHPPPTPSASTGSSTIKRVQRRVGPTQRRRPWPPASAGADHLISHFVDQARRSGIFLSPISARAWASPNRPRKPSLSQKPPRGFKPGLQAFPAAGHNAVVAAQNAARRAASSEVTPDPHLLGVLTDPATGHGVASSSRRSTSQLCVQRSRSPRPRRWFRLA